MRLLLPSCYTPRAGWGLPPSKSSTHLVPSLLCLDLLLACQTIGHEFRLMEQGLPPLLISSYRASIQPWRMSLCRNRISNLRAPRSSSCRTQLQLPLSSNSLHPLVSCPNQASSALRSLNVFSSMSCQGSAPCWTDGDRHSVFS